MMDAGARRLVKSGAAMALLIDRSLAPGALTATTPQTLNQELTS
jgi:hypothetical protein